MTASIPCVARCTASTLRMSSAEQRHARILERLVDVGERAAIQVVEDHDARGIEIAQQQVDRGRRDQSATTVTRYLDPLISI